jgi:hypothetical protein
MKIKITNLHQDARDCILSEMNKLVPFQHQLEIFVDSQESELYTSPGKSYITRSRSIARVLAADAGSRWSMFSAGGGAGCQRQ